MSFANRSKRLGTFLGMAGAVALAAGWPATAAAGDTTYAYDGAGRLAKTVRDGITTTYGYDGLDGLAERCVAGVCVDIVLDENREFPSVIGESAFGSTTGRFYAYGPDGSEVERVGVGVRELLTDHLGSVRGAVGADGAVSARGATDVYGATRASTGVAPTLGFAGEVGGGADGVTWLRARSYSAESGRFLQRDSFGGFAQRGASLNRYSYVENAPASAVDPSGHFLVNLPLPVLHELASPVLRGLNSGPQSVDGSCAMAAVRKFNTEEVLASLSPARGWLGNLASDNNMCQCKAATTANMIRGRFIEQIRRGEMDVDVMYFRGNDTNVLEMVSGGGSHLFVRVRIGAEVKFIDNWSYGDGRLLADIPTPRDRTDPMVQAAWIGQPETFCAKAAVPPRAHPQMLGSRRWNASR